VQRGGGRPGLAASKETECGKGTPVGRCEAARIPVTDYRLEVAGPEPRAVHVITATAAASSASGAAGSTSGATGSASGTSGSASGATGASSRTAGSATIAEAPAPVRLAGEGWEGVRVAAARDAVVVWPLQPGAALRYRVPRGQAVTHVVLDAPAAAGGTARVTARVTARIDGDACAVEVVAGTGAGALPAQPLIITLDAACAVTLDAERPPDVAWPIDAADLGDGGGLGTAHVAPPAPHPAYRRSHRPARGCCGAQAAPDPTMALVPAVLAALLLRRRRRSC